MGHVFGPERCHICDVRWHNQHKYPCIDERNTMSQNKMKDVLTKFEETRPQHGGVIVDASPYLEMSDSALQRALFRAKKEGWDGHFTTTRKKADFSTEEAVLGIVYIEDPVVEDITVTEVAERVFVLEIAHNDDRIHVSESS